MTSSISDWEPPRRFVDRQLRGPYRLWIHEHSFHERPEGTEVRDRVDYTLPLRGLGVARFVARDLRGIFTYRQRALADLFD